MIPPILSLCARIEGHPTQRVLLERACESFSEWDTLLLVTEAHGMAPLLHKHLLLYQEFVPDNFFRGLRFLCLRHRQANLLLMDCLHQLLSLLEENGIPSLILKGAALCHTVYPEPEMRPMRDLDILLTKEDAAFAHRLLQKHGFVYSAEKSPQGYYHLPALLTTIGGMQICVELHHGLFPDDPPYYQQLTYADLYKKALPFTVGGITAFCPGPEDMLYHLYQHGFHAPLTFEPYKLISLADIVNLVEQKTETIDWGIMKNMYPQVLQALPLFHHLTPWSDAALQKVPFQVQKRPEHTGKPYAGWPRNTFSGKSRRKRLLLLCETIYPGKWWLMLYYNTNSILSVIFCRAIQHPLHLLRWIKVYARMYRKKKGAPEQAVRFKENQSL